MFVYFRTFKDIFAYMPNSRVTSDQNKNSTRMTFLIPQHRLRSSLPASEYNKVEILVSAKAGLKLFDWFS